MPAGRTNEGPSARLIPARRASEGPSAGPIRPPPISPTRERRSGVAHRARMRPGRTDRTDRPSLARRAGIEPARQGVRNPFVIRSGGRLRCGTGPFRAGPAAAGGSVVRGQWSVVREDPTDTPPGPTGCLPTLSPTQFDNLAQRTRFPKLVAQRGRAASNQKRFTTETQRSQRRIL